MNIIPVTLADEVVRHALVTPPTPIEWTEPPEPAAIVPPKGDDGRPGLTH
jgi:hypothetical protein